MRGINKPMPKVLIFAGANGSGKTTLASTVLEPLLLFVNADEIKVKEGLSDLDASKKALRTIDLYISKGADFSFETTMSGLGLQKRFEQLENNNYHITIFYLFAYPVELLKERIKERQKKGGHAIAEEDIIRRYYRSVKNFWNIYGKYAGEWVIINNNEFQYRNIAVGHKETFDIIDENEFKIFKEVLKNDKSRRA